MLQKIRKLRDLISSKGYRTRIEVDGGIGPENLDELLAAGADIIVAGSAVFRASTGASDAVMELKGIAERHSRIFEIS
jgi:ribulose-phosphate 3-epimerase